MDSTSSQRKIPRPKYLRNGREQVTALSALALLVVAQPKRCSLDTLLHIKRKHFLCVEGPVFFAVRKVRAPRRSNGTCGILGTMSLPAAAAALSFLRSSSVRSKTFGRRPGQRHLIDRSGPRGRHFGPTGHRDGCRK